MEVESSAILDLVGSSQPLSCLLAMLFFQRSCPASLPPISIPGRNQGERHILRTYQCANGIFFLRFIYLFIDLYLAVLGLYCSTQAFQCSKQELLFIVASRCSGFSCYEAYGLQYFGREGFSGCGFQALGCWLSSCSTWASLL